MPPPRASASHHPGIAAGDAIGANVTMLTLVLGLAALIRPLRFAGRVRGYALGASASGAAAAIAVLGGSISRAAGALLAALYLLTVAVIWRRERQPPAFGEATELREENEPSDENEEDRRPGRARRHTRAALLVVIGVAGMAAGGQLAVSGATRIVEALGLRETAVGLTFVALATTAELFALVWAAFRRDVEELALAGVRGSAIYNATATLGVAALIRPLAVGGLAAQAWLAAALPAGIVLWALAFGRLGRVGGLLLITAYGAFLASTFA